MGAWIRVITKANLNGGMGEYLHSIALYDCNHISMPLSR